MRISDWSSDVCSSDLFSRNRRWRRMRGMRGRRFRARFFELPIGWKGRAGRHPMVRPRDGAAAGAEALRTEGGGEGGGRRCRSEEHTSKLQSLMRISYAVFCLNKKKQNRDKIHKE